MTEPTEHALRDAMDWVIDEIDAVSMMGDDADPHWEYTLGTIRAALEIASKDK